MAGYDDHQSDYSGYDAGYNDGYDAGYADASEPQDYFPSARQRKERAEENARRKAEEKKLMWGCGLAVLVASVACYLFSVLTDSIMGSP